MKKEQRHKHIKTFFTAGFVVSLTVTVLLIFGAIWFSPLSMTGKMIATGIGTGTSAIVFGYGAAA